MFEIEYYENGRGIKPVEELIDSLSLKMQVKVFGRLELLEEYGPLLPAPYSKHLEDGIYELRIVHNGNQVRILYFFVSEKTLVLTHGFVKKTQKTPRREIKKAKRLRADWNATNERF